MNGYGVARRAACRLGALVVLALAAGCGGGGGSGDDAPPDDPGAAAGFSVTVSPATAQAFAGSGRQLELGLNRTGGFTGEVTVTLDHPPVGVTAQPLIFSGRTPALTLVLRLDETAAPSDVVLALTASSGGLTQSLAAPLSIQPPGPDAPQLIAQALAANAIDAHTALLYRLYALHGDPRLPEAFVGAGAAEEDWRVFGQVEAVLPQMSAAMQAAVRPFLVRPDHPESIYRRAVPGASGTAGRERPSALAGLAPPPASTCVAGSQWRSVRSATIPVRVWSECQADEALTLWNSDKADTTLTVFEKIWPRMTALMGAPRLDGGTLLDDAGRDITDNGGDDAIDVYLVSGYSLSRASRPINTAALGKAVGFARPAGPCVTNAAGTLSCSGYMVMPAFSAGSNSQRATVVHEFFHVLQFRHNSSLAFVEDWFYEASATWVESHVDRVLDWPVKVALTEVHRPRFQRFMSATESVNASVGPRPYAAYIWPFFLEQETGSSLIIGQIWTALAAARTAADEDRIVDAAYGFDTNFHRFALRNVNEELLPGNPVAKRYIDLAGSADGVRQFPDGVVKPKYVDTPLKTGRTATVHYGIEPWSAEYTRFTIDGEGLPGRVEFDFSGLADRGHLKLDALVRTTTAAGDEWVDEAIALNPDARAVFCFELGKSTRTVRGEFKELRLVLSNSAPNLRIGGDVIVRPTHQPCGTWEGTVEATHEIELPTGTLRITSTAQLAFAYDEVNSSAGARAFQVRSGNYRYRAYYDFPGGSTPCRTEQTASGAMHAQGESMDLSDGSTAGAMATSVSIDGTPQYAADRIVTFTTFTEVSNCNDRHVDVTTLLPMQSIAIWVLESQRDITVGGTTMQGTRSVESGPSRSTYTWLLTKKSE